MPCSPTLRNGQQVWLCIFLVHPFSRAYKSALCGAIKLGCRHHCRPVSRISLFVWSSGAGSPRWCARCQSAYFLRCKSRTRFCAGGHSVGSQGAQPGPQRRWLPARALNRVNSQCNLSNMSFLSKVHTFCLRSKIVSIHNNLTAPLM